MWISEVLRPFYSNVIVPLLLDLGKPSINDFCDSSDYSRSWVRSLLESTISCCRCRCQKLASTHLDPNPGFSVLLHQRQRRGYVLSVWVYGCSFLYVICFGNLGKLTFLHTIKWNFRANRLKEIVLFCLLNIFIFTAFSGIIDFTNLRRSTQPIYLEAEIYIKKLSPLDPIYV